MTHGSEKLKMIQEGIKNYPSKENVESLVMEIKKYVSNYQKHSLLNWLSLASVLIGNELYLMRFTFIQRTILSMKDSEFGKSELNQNELGNLLQLTKKVSWTHVEDYVPRKNNEENIFGLENKEYNFLTGGLDHPENQLEDLPKRYFELSRLYNNKLNLKDELVKLLEIQTDIIKFVSLLNTDQIDIFVLPKGEDVRNWSNLLNKNKNKLSNIWGSSHQMRVPSELSLELENPFLENPIVDGIPYVPCLLIHALIEKVREELKINLNNKVKALLRLQLKTDILNSLSELIPQNGLIPNFSINNKENIEVGFIYDNRIFLFFVIPETFNNKQLLEEIDKIEKIKDNLEIEFQKEVILYSKEVNHKVTKKLEPVFITVLDDLYPKMYPIPLSKNGNSTIMSASALRFIFEDLVDNERSMTYLLKVIKKFNTIRTVHPLEFADFYSFLSRGGNYSFLMLQDNSNLVLDPHFWTEDEFTAIKNKRPRFDYRPSEYELPYTFKFRKSEKGVIFGYNHLLEHYFYLIKKKESNLFILSERDIEIDSLSSQVSNLLNAFLSNLIIELHDNEIRKQDKFVFKLIPLNKAIEMGLPKREQKYPIMVLGINSSEFHVIFNPEAMLFIYSQMQDNFLKFFIDNFVKLIVTDSSFSEASKRLNNPHIFDDFTINQIPINSSLHNFSTTHPSHLDISDVEVEILSFLKSNDIKEGTYKATQADKIVKKLYNHLLDLLNNKIKNYDLRSVVKFGLFESENVLRGRKVNLARLIGALKSTYLKDVQDSTLEKESILRPYYPSVRYLIESIVLNNVSGSNQIHVYEWQELTALTMKIIELANISEFLHSQSELFNVNLKIDFSELAHFDIVLNDNPLKEQIEENVKGFDKEDSKIEDYFPPIQEEVDPNNFVESFNDKLKVGGLSTLNQLLKKNFGFQIPEYAFILNMMTHLQEKADKYGVIDTPYIQVVDFIKEKTKLDESTIHAVLDFSTLYKDKEVYIEAWRVNTRKNRLTIKPLIRYGDNLIFAPETLSSAIDRVAQSIISGGWPYFIEGSLPEDLEKELSRVRGKLDKKFETFLFEELMKITSLCERNICSSNVNDKCFINIQEKCIGEIDCFSLHPELKIAFVWEAKNIISKYGSREIVGDLQEFTEDEGYITKLNSKRDYVQRNISQILSYYKINDDPANWKIVSCIVLSSSSLIRNILKKKTNIINFSEIKEFISLANQTPI